MNTEDRLRRKSFDFPWENNTTTLRRGADRGDSGFESGQSRQRSGSEGFLNISFNIPNPTMPDQEEVPAKNINSVPKFDGRDTSDVKNWVAAVDDCQELYAWNNKQTLAVVALKLEGQAATWLRAERLEENFPTVWKTDGLLPGLKPLLLARFGKSVSTATAVDAISSLKQLPSESVDRFYDRVRIAVDEKNFSIEPKTGQTYFKAREQDIKIFLLAGLHEELRQIVLGVPNAPTTLLQILPILRTAETERAAKKSQVMKIDTTESSDVEQLEFMVQQFWRDRNRPRGSSSSSKPPLGCWNCNSRSHFRAECPYPAKDPLPFKSKQGTPSQQRPFQQQPFQVKPNQFRGKANSRGQSQPYTSGYTNRQFQQPQQVRQQQVYEDQEPQDQTEEDQFTYDTEYEIHPDEIRAQDSGNCVGKPNQNEME